MDLRSLNDGAIIVPSTRSHMDAAERERLIKLINDPPPGSKIAEAKDYGLDLTLLLSRLELTPTERLEELHSAQEFIQQLRGAMSASR